MKYLILLFILAGCSSNQNMYDFGPYEKEAKEFQKLLLEKKGWIMAPIKIEITDEQNGRQAWCIHKEEGPQVIKVRRGVHDANLYNWEFREILIFHEMGHCILGREHTEIDSLMRQFLFFDQEYAPNRDYYINELFSGT